MKKITFNLFVFSLFCAPLFMFAQKTQHTPKKIFNQNLTSDNQQAKEETGIIPCATVEYESYLQTKFSERSNTEAFENWLAPKVQKTKSDLQAGNFRFGVKTIPIIFHVLTDGGLQTNLTLANVQAQVDQLNIDYGNLAGSMYASSADAQIQFCLAQVDPNGNVLEEPGINRITNLGVGPFDPDQIDASIKPATQWNPESYFNVWSMNITQDILGYAQFPSNSTLPGANGLGGPANTDGVVIAPFTVGSKLKPNAYGAPYNKGRTLTHEAGHWLGLRHIWGDTTSCANADFCADTPDATGPNYNCSNVDSCPYDGLGRDMVENYMDYTADNCMNTFTADQVARMLTVMNNSPRRVNLATSTACQAPVIYDLDGKLDLGTLNMINCGETSITPELILTNKGINTLSSATITYAVNGSAQTTINWTGTLAQNAIETISLPTLPLAVSAYTFTATLSNPNGGTDEQLSNNAVTANFSITGDLCSSVGTIEYPTSNTGVIFNTISNLNTSKPSGYSDYTEMSTEVNHGSVYNLTVNANSGGNYQIITYVWIDWNQNCSFDDEGEFYDLGTSASLDNAATANSPLAITVPEGAVLGNTTMRVITKYTDPNANQFPTPCMMAFDGETEDYTITVTSALGVKDQTLSGFTIYPNPSKDHLNIALSNNNELPDSYTVYNTLGQVIFNKNIRSNADLSVNTSALGSGMYFIKIFKESRQISLPFIKE